MKSHKSKLDQFAAQLADLDVEKKTLSEICEWLASEGCRVSPSRVSEYLERLRSDRRQAALLTQITNGARQCAEVEKQFGKNPAPELETLIKLQRVILLNLSTQANADPSLLALIGNSFKAVLTAEKLKLQREEVSLAKQKFLVDADFYFERLLAKAGELNTSNLSNAEKIAAMRAEAFKSVDELQASGKIKIPKA